MSAAITFLASIGALTLVIALLAAIRWAIESTIYRHYKGLRDQIDEAAVDAKCLLMQFEKDTPEALWAINELSFIARMRRYAPRSEMRQRLENALEQGANVGFPVGEEEAQP